MAGWPNIKVGILYYDAKVNIVIQLVCLLAHSGERLLHFGLLAVFLPSISPAWFRQPIYNLGGIQYKVQVGMCVQQRFKSFCTSSL